MTSLTAKTALALGWHIVDLGLDAGRAPRWARLAWAGLGLTWAVYFMSQLPGSLVKHQGMTWHYAKDKVSGK